MPHLYVGYSPLTNNLLNCWDIQVAILTFPKTNIAPDSVWLEDDISYWEGLFSRDMLSSRRAKFILQNACLICFLQKM